ncbi:P-selectin, partial [Ophiophagus hannah]
MLSLSTERSSVQWFESLVPCNGVSSLVRKHIKNASRKIETTFGGNITVFHEPSVFSHAGQMTTEMSSDSAGSSALKWRRALTPRMGFKIIGSKRLNCTATGEWAGFAPFCEAIKCPPLKETENMKKNCSHPWGHFSYSSACHFYCTEGFLLNGTSKIQCQPDGQWSTEMPVCQGRMVLCVQPKSCACANEALQAHSWLQQSGSQWVVAQ